MCQTPEIFLLKLPVSIALFFLDSICIQFAISAESKYYLQTDIVIGDRTVKTKRTEIHANLLDIFDCGYAFQIPCKHLDVCCLSFTVVELVHNGAQITRERPWGRFTVGPCSYAHGTGVDHWKMMLSNSRKVIEMWHVIARAYQAFHDKVKSNHHCQSAFTWSKAL